MRIFLFLSMFVVLSFPVQAQEEDMLCTLLSVYQPSDDVAYKAGVDVNGNAVVPADLNTSKIQLPTVIKVPLQLDMAKRLERMMAINLEADAQLGLVEIYDNGRVVYDGKTITKSTAAACALSHRYEPKEQTQEGLENVIETPQSDNGQKDVNPIQSEPVVEPKKSIIPFDEDRDLLEGEEHKD